jgi:signal transduction histidine kinase/CheY-like chemotaxis protein
MAPLGKDALGAETELRRSAQAWQATFDAISDGVALLDSAGRVVRANESLARLVGRPLAELLGAPPPIPLDAPIPTGDARHTREVRVGERWLELTSHPVLDSEADAGTVLVLADVTERKRGEVERAELLERAQAARREAERANQLKDEFLATLSHELRTPLNAILGWATILRTRPMDEEVRVRAADVIERNAHSQKQLIEDILDVSRVVAGRLQLDLSSTDPTAVVESALESMRPAAEARGVRLDFGPRLPGRRVEADADRLRQIVANLLSNAIKFTAPGGAVSVRLAEAEGGLAIEVRDTGVGIEREFLPHVFERFRQADSSTTRRHGGLGLGLAIVRHLVELHGGRVGADSPGPGGGATFTVWLPQRPPALAAGAPRPPEAGGGEPERPRPAHDGRPRLDGVRVLVVEDEPDTLDLVATILRERGAEVQAVESVAQARAALDRRPPDVLLSDLGLPGEDGFALIREVRLRPPERGGNVPAAALSAYAREQDKHRALQAGFQDHVIKPVQPADLVELVARLAGRAG